MTDNVDLNELLERQQEAQNPLMAVLLGTVARLDNALSFLTDFNTMGGSKKKVISKDLQKWITESKEYIGEIEAAGLFVPLVLKVQRPLSSNVPGFNSDKGLMQTCLVYNEDRSLCESMFLDGVAWGWLGNDLKMYASARLWTDGSLQLIARIKDQSW